MFLDLISKFIDLGIIKYVLISAIASIIILIVFVFFIGMTLVPYIAPCFIILTTCFTAMFLCLRPKKESKD